MKKVEFMGWKNCVEMQNGDFKLIITTDVGPRIIGAFYKGGENMFHVKKELAGKTGGDEWVNYGGHRLWHAPEDKVRTYEPDNSSAGVEEKTDGIEFSQPPEKNTGIRKSFTVSPISESRFKITHRIKNENLWDIELAAWALSVMAPGGTAIVPQPQGDKKALLPNRYLTVWPYTDMSDERLTWGNKYIMLKQSPEAESPCKFGINCEDGWIAYVNRGQALIKYFEHFSDAEYPDNGCSIETYTNNIMLEIETLSPLYLLGPGEEMEHIEIFHAAGGIGEIKNEKDAAENFPSFLFRE